MNEPAAKEALSARAVSEIAGDEGVELIDVREPHEFEAGHIAGSQNIALNELSARAGEIDRERQIVFYCRSGSRSAMATDAFTEAGYNARNMEGGMLSWVESELPIEPAGGGVAEPRPPS